MGGSMQLAPTDLYDTGNNWVWGDRELRRGSQNQDRPGIILVGAARGSVHPGNNWELDDREIRGDPRPRKIVGPSSWVLIGLCV